MKDYTKLAADAIVIKDGKILLGLRKNGYQAGMWALPGGHLEYEESLAEVARRELLEETGMTAERFELRSILNLKGMNKHYVLFGFEAINPQGEPELKEPDRCVEWRWFPLDALPENLCEPHMPHFKILRGELGMFYEN